MDIIIVIKCKFTLFFPYASKKNSILLTDSPYSTDYIQDKVWKLCQKRILIRCEKEVKKEDER